MTTAGPHQGGNAPLGGSDSHAVKRLGGSFAAGPSHVVLTLTSPPEGETRPPWGAATRAAAERGGKLTRRPVHGVLLLDKPLGWSSNDALQKVKWLLRAEKAGHTGTLDPLATGVLPLCFGAATKFSQLQLDADKTYEAVARLGVKTSTADAEGEVLEVRPVNVTEEELAQVVLRFTGRIRQTPPMHSALKKDGKALYEYARAGIEVERASREITIYELKVGFENVDSGQAALQMTVKCSKGTYIRTLAEDIGEALGCGASLNALRRVQSGGFDVPQCVTLAALEAMTEEERLQCLLPVASLLQGHTVVTLDDENAGRFLSGVRRRGAWPDAEQVAVYGPGMTSVRAEPVEAAESPSTGSGRTVLLGTAHVKAGELIPVRLLSPPEIEQMKDYSSLRLPRHSVPRNDRSAAIHDFQIAASLRSSQ